ncbi:hypothetical protein FOXYSP1_20729 [Fusarium oxysporum f. sp. phaseoli]
MATTATSMILVYSMTSSSVLRR